MDTPRHLCSGPARTAPSSTAIHVTLYDLLATLQAAVRPDEDAVVTAVVVHLLQTHRVTCTDNQERYRLVWDGDGCPARSGQPDAAQSLSGERRYPRG